MHTYMYMYNELILHSVKATVGGRGEERDRGGGGGRGPEKNSGCLYNIYLTHITPEVISAPESFDAPLEAEV